MQTILGAGGIIGKELARALKSFTDKIRLVNRNPQKINDNDELVPADLLDLQQVRNAVRDSEVVYLTVGFPYNLKTWQTSWPKAMENTISACKEFNSKLVFFDNIYMYDPRHLNGMTEETPINPASKKGIIRSRISKQLMEEVEKGKLSALIARAADFYGPGIKKVSIITEMLLNPLSRGKTANWLCSDKYKHSFTYTPDAGKATAILGNSPEAFNQIWHLPTAANPLTGKEWIERAAQLFGVKPKYRILSTRMIKFMGLFMPVIREIAEMMYQYDRDYVFDSSKFERHFDFNTTSYEDGLKTIIDSDYKKE